MSYLSKLKKMSHSWGLLVILSIFLMGASDCFKKQPWGFILFYEHPNMGGKCFSVAFNNAKGAVKWDKYDFENIVGDNTISSFQIYANMPTTLILCENEHFKGRYYKLNVKPEEGWVNINDLGGFNDLTSSIIVTNNSKGIRILLTAALEPFREELKKAFLGSKNVEGVTLKETKILWDTELNFMNTYSGYPYCDYYEGLKNSDLIQFCQDIIIDPNWWPADYKVTLRFWLRPICENGGMTILAYDWNASVEKGLIKSSIESNLKMPMDKGLENLKKAVQGISAFLLIFSDKPERIGFTLPDSNDPPNPYAGQSPGMVESMPPIVSVHGAETATADAAREKDPLKGAVPPDKDFAKITSLPITGEGNRPRTDMDQPMKTTETFGPEITNNIKKLGFKNEKEYREKLLNYLGIEKGKEKNVKIVQMTDNGVPYISITGGMSMDNLPPSGQLDKPIIEMDTKKITPNAKEVKAKLEDLLKKMETSSSISISQLNQLVVLMNEATRLGVMKPKFQERYRKLILNKTKPYRQ